MGKNLNKTHYNICFANTWQLSTTHNMSHTKWCQEISSSKNCPDCRSSLYFLILNVFCRFRSISSGVPPKEIFGYLKTQSNYYCFHQMSSLTFNIESVCIHRSAILNKSNHRRRALIVGGPLDIHRIQMGIGDICIRDASCKSQWT